ncbi:MULTISPECIES: aspartyl-phosphate phosphatase Spo0E family protein [Metabacillus]|uniref:Aspartyl-phosphate phosphatase Spo0E family protein n=1 Tax=Metabacillus elymi TaxID=2745198 RepID=A0ABX6S7F8_9BACI|nr:MULTISPECIES: aspartyl-phosphate phosphatase Spo0E family protein [Metabacillus]QNF29944.1 aspartyl-phosphate phosphatase Spo0E family protein [Metabacillus sp. KUDC1714]
MDKKNKLLLVIEYKREELHLIVDKFGIISNEALKCSKELDILINKYQKLNK